MNAFMRFITDPQNLLSIGVGVAVFASVLTMLGSFIGGGARLDKRMKAVAERREELRRRSRQAMRGGAGETGGGLRRTDDSFRSRVVARLNLVKLLEDPKVAENMIQAGFRGPGPLNTFYFFRFSLPFILMALTAFYLFVVIKPDLPGFTLFSIVILAAGVGFYAPNIYLKNLIDKRRQSIVAAFPDSLDLLLICVESGMSIEAAIQKVSQEVGGQSIELAEELSLLSAELSYLPERRLAYEGMAKRTQHPGIRAVATAMTQAETYGCLSLIHI